MLSRTNRSESFWKFPHKLSELSVRNVAYVTVCVGHEFCSPLRSLQHQRGLKTETQHKVIRETTTMAFTANDFLHFGLRWMGFSDKTIENTCEATSISRFREARASTSGCWYASNGYGHSHISKIRHNFVAWIRCRKVAKGRCQRKPTPSSNQVIPAKIFPTV